MKFFTPDTFFLSNKPLVHHLFIWFPHGYCKFYIFQIYAPAYGFHSRIIHLYFCCIQKLCCRQPSQWILFFVAVLLMLLMFHLTKYQIFIHSFADFEFFFLSLHCPWFLLFFHFQHANPILDFYFWFIEVFALELSNFCHSFYHQIHWNFPFPLFRIHKNQRLYFPPLCCQNFS